MFAFAFLVAYAAAAVTDEDVGPVSGTIKDMEHIVIFMQENRAYDHYYGSMRGVRGFNDRAAPLLPSGRNPFHQPIKGENGEETDDYLLPYPLSFEKTKATCMGAPQMSYPSDIHIWNGGNMDAWNTARSPGFGMSFFNRTELPYYYALGDAFTMGDQYFQSTFTATCPNREHLFSGSNGLSVGSQWNLLDDSEPKGVNWTTMGEILEEKNISWRVYMEANNFDDNGFAWFDQYRAARPGNALYDKGMARQHDFVQAFADDVGNDTLPQVSWLVGPSYLSEHATNHPADGEDLSARLLAILAKPENKKVYAKTAFILNYDEGGQFYDHHWTPCPPRNAKDGKSTVTTKGELTREVRYKSIPAGNPIGLGFRVPFFIISPWTRGDYVYSEVADHTSVIQLIEKRFDVHCPNISPWRRAITGDLTSAFDFSAADYSWPKLPDTSGYVNASKWQCKNLPAPVVPKVQKVPVQEKGTKKARPLPYEFLITDAVGTQLTIMFKNTGKAGAVFNVYDYANPKSQPKKYTVEAGKDLSDVWPLAKADQIYNLSLHGPNGFVRQFSGNGLAAALSAQLEYDTKNEKVTVVVASTTKADCDFTVVDNAYSQIKPTTVSTSAKKASNSLSVPCAADKTGSWYDLTVASTCVSKGKFSRRFMGRMETGKETTSDPAMGAAKIQQEENHPPIPERYRHIAWDPEKECNSLRGQQKDQCWFHNHQHDEL